MTIIRTAVGHYGRMAATIAKRASVAALVASCVMVQPASAGDAEGTPFWASLRKDQANLRVGPGRDYRISWIYVRAGVPVKVLRAREGWVLVEDQDGARGWMLTQFVTSKVRTGVVKGAPAEIRETKDGSGRLLWRAAPGVVGRLTDCAAGWCKVDISGKQGFISQSAMWGAGAP